MASFETTVTVLISSAYILSIKIMDMKKPSLLVILLSFSSSVFSAASYETITVCGLQTHTNSNYAYLRVCESRPSNNGCSSGGFVSWNIADGQGKVMYSTAMAALVSGNSVTLKMDGKTCLSAYDATYMIRINK
ncbi:hypothetical protein [Enterovibrio norvegicus]|uniref:Uncharacterized protein n=2 Tax=Enterovibrio norvegicus TaxID=188144 RepID=A0ABV4KWY2_9GAMM